MSEAFEKWFKTTLLPAECDDERVIVGLRLCWNAAIESIEAVPIRAILDEGYAAGYRDGLRRQEVQGE